MEKKLADVGAFLQKIPIGEVLKMVKKIFMICLALVNGASFADVGPDGSYNHSIAIELPLSRGPAPTLSINYNSNAGYGLLGKGWDLSGLPVIYRGVRTQAVKYNDADDMMGPNGPLISATNSTGEKVYRNSLEDFQIYKPVYGGCVGPCSWVSTDKNGYRYYFGNTDDSRLAGDEIACRAQRRPLNECTSAYRVWALNRVEDPYGNYYTVEYWSRAGEGALYPDRIKYGMGPGHSAHYLIAFGYTGLNNFSSQINKEYSQSAMSKKNFLLNAIRVMKDTWFSGEIRGYSFLYNTQDYFPESPGYNGPLVDRLERIYEYGSDENIQKPEVKLTYTNGSMRIDGHWSPRDGKDEVFQNMTNHDQLLFGDVNGDMKQDVVHIVPKDAFNNISVLTKFTGTDRTEITRFRIPPVGFFDEFLLTDVNGDGRSDLVGVLGVGDDSELSAALKRLTGSVVQIAVALADAEGHFGIPQSHSIHEFNSIRILKSWSLAENEKYYKNQKMELCDLDGDGIKDLLRISTHVGTGVSGETFQISVAMGSASGEFSPLRSIGGRILGNEALTPDKFSLKFADIDGDGRCDILAIAKEAGKQSLVFFASSFLNLNASLNGVIPPDAFLDFNESNGQFFFYLADVNGDGVLDLVRAHQSSAPGGPGISTLLGTGVGSFVETQEYRQTLTDDTYCSSFDVTGVVTDIVRPDSSFSTAISGFNDSIDSGIQYLAQWTMYKLTRPAVADCRLNLADLNGDGRSDLVVTRNESRRFSVFLGQYNGKFSANRLQFDSPLGWSPEYPVDSGETQANVTTQGALENDKNLHYLSFFADTDGDGVANMVMTAAKFHLPEQTIWDKLFAKYGGVIPNLIKTLLSDETVTMDLVVRFFPMKSIKPDQLVALESNGAVEKIEYAQAKDFPNAISWNSQGCQSTVINGQSAPTGIGYGKPCGIPDRRPRNLVVKIRVESDRSLKNIASPNERESFEEVYMYFNGRIYPGKVDYARNLGFDYVIKANITSGENVTTYYNQVLPFAGMPVLETSVYPRDNESGLRRIIYTQYKHEARSCPTLNGCPLEPGRYQYSDAYSIPGWFGNSVLQLQTTEIKKTEFQTAQPGQNEQLIASSFETFAYDDFGNVLKQNEGKRFANQGYTQFERVMTYANDLGDSDFSKRSIGRLLTEKSCSVVDCASNTQDSEIQSNAEYVYADIGTTYQLKDKWTFLGNRAYSFKTNYEYYPHGGVKKITDPVGNTEEVFYDSTFAVYPETLVSKQGAITRTINMDIDLRLGVAKTINLPSGQVITREYDSFGRLTSETQKVDNINYQSNYEYHLWGNGDNSHFTKSCLRDVVDRCSYVYFDSLGRSYLSITPSSKFNLDDANDGNALIPYEASFVTVDPSSRQIRQSLPYGVNAPGANVSLDSVQGYTTQDFDTTGRLVKTTLPDGKIIRESYTFGSTSSSHRSTENSTGKYKETFYNILGQPIKIRQGDQTNAASIIYNYRSNHLLDSVVSPQGTTSLTYDPQTNLRLTLTEPFTGTTRFEYYLDPSKASFGKLKKEEAPRSNVPGSENSASVLVHNYDYDDYGRLTRKYSRELAQDQRTQGQIILFDEVHFTYMTYDDSATGLGRPNCLTSGFSAPGESGINADARNLSVTDFFEYSSGGRATGRNRYIAGQNFDMNTTSASACTAPTDRIRAIFHVGEETDSLGRMSAFINPDTSRTVYGYMPGSSVVRSIGHKPTGLFSSENPILNYKSRSKLNGGNPEVQLSFGNPANSRTRATYQYNQLNGLLKDFTVASRNVPNVTAPGNMGTSGFSNSDDPWVNRMSLSYEYDSMNNIQKITNSIPKLTQTMTYDALNRLTTVYRPSATLELRNTFSYSFTDTGSQLGRSTFSKKDNRIFKYLPIDQFGNDKNLFPLSAQVFDKDTSDQTRLPSKFENYKWDFAGNLISTLTQNNDGSFQEIKRYGYNSLNQLVSVDIFSGNDQLQRRVLFYYDSSGNRFLKVMKQNTGEEKRTYYFGETYERVEIWQNSTTLSNFQESLYILGADGGRVAQIAKPVGTSSGLISSLNYGISDLPYSAGMTFAKSMSFLFYGFINDTHRQRLAFGALMILVVFGAGAYVYSSHRRRNPEAKSGLGLPV